VTKKLVHIKEKETLHCWTNRFYAVIDEGDSVEAESPELAVCRASLLSVLATENAQFP
jgi:hypothetical protein